MGGKWTISALPLWEQDPNLPLGKPPTHSPCENKVLFQPYSDSGWVIEARHTGASHPITVAGSGMEHGSAQANEIDPRGISQKQEKKTPLPSSKVPSAQGHTPLGLSEPSKAIR